MEKSYWLNRFRVTRFDAHRLCFEDRLHAGCRLLPESIFASLAPDDLDIELMRRGFLDAALPAVLGPVTDKPKSADDSLFWQFPCRTEGAAWELHDTLAEPMFDGSAIHVYLGLPWATLLDRRRVDPDQPQVQRELKAQRVRISGFRGALASRGVRLRVHTVCQHVYWRELLSTWSKLGVTDAWLSHAPPDVHQSGFTGLELHPWRLFAVNVEDASRSGGLRIGADPATKPLLASFVGAHADHYISDVRLRLRALGDQPGFHVRVTERWHFEDVVYGHQVEQRPLVDIDTVCDSVQSYNALLSDSRFSLCPSGAGPNTLRLWESLAVGSVPVLLGAPPEMPKGGSLATPIDWDLIVLRIEDHQISELPTILSKIPLDEVRRRQQLGMQAFARAREQRCF